MTDNIVTLRPGEPAAADNVVPLQESEYIQFHPNESIIEELEGLLGAAKRGEIMSFAYAATRPPHGDFYTGWCGAVKPPLLAAIACLNVRFVRAIDEGAARDITITPPGDPA